MTKQQWRARLLAARRARPEPERAAAREAISRHLLAELAGSVRAERDDHELWRMCVEIRGKSSTGNDHPAATTVCAFHSLPSEPLAADLPDRLAAAGARVLVPVARQGAPLDWCELPAGPGLAGTEPTGPGPAGPATVTGPLGIAEPSGPRLGPAAIREADIVLVPALAVDGHGVRLGRGGGHYDRSLALLPAGRLPRLIAVVYDDEVVDTLPRDAHDMPVTEVLTPAGGLRRVAQEARPGASSN